MANRPAPRMSGLRDRTPAAPAPAATSTEPDMAVPAIASATSVAQPQQEVAAEPPAAVSAAPDVVQDSPAAAPAAPAASAGKKSSFYLGPVTRERMRAAYAHAWPREGFTSLSDLVDKAIMAEVERLEAEYNNGEPFPAVGERAIPRGRPISYS